MSDYNNKKRKASSTDDVPLQQTPKKQKFTECKKPATNGTSTRQAMRSKINNVGATNKSQGVVRDTPDGGLEWYDKKAHVWVAAVYHNDIRNILLNRASHNGALQYTHGRAEGTATDDKTAFHRQQQHWCGERNQWPVVRGRNILHQFEKRGYSSGYVKGDVEFMKDPYGRIGKVPP